MMNSARRACSLVSRGRGVSVLARGRTAAMPRHTEPCTPSVAPGTSTAALRRMMSSHIARAPQVGAVRMASAVPDLHHASSSNAHPEDFSADFRPGNGTPMTLTTNADGVRVSWSKSAASAEVPFVFLRDHCRCAECFNPHTFQRQVETMDIPLDITPRSVELADGGLTLRLTWADGHVSDFNSGWLFRCGLNKRMDTRSLWSSVGYNAQTFWGTTTFRNDKGEHDKSMMPTVEYKDALTDQGLYDYLNKIRLFGFCVMKDVPIDEKTSFEISNRIGVVRDTLYGKYYEVKILPRESGNDTAYTEMALPAHTDGCYWSDQPGLQMWHCIEADKSGGGDNLLVDGFRVGQVLRERYPDTFKYFSETEIPFGFRDKDNFLVNFAKVFALDGRGNITHFRYNNNDRAVLSHFSAQEIKTFYRHLQVLLKELNSDEHVAWLGLRPGDILTVYNRRVMHGRAAFSPTSGRYYRGCYYSYDDYISKLMAMEHQLGYASHDALM